MGVLATFAITDQEGNVLVVFKMTGAPSTVLIGSTDLMSGQPTELTNERPIRTDWRSYAYRSPPAWAFLATGRRSRPSPKRAPRRSSALRAARSRRAPRVSSSRRTFRRASAANPAGTSSAFSFHHSLVQTSGILGIAICPISRSDSRAIRVALPIYKNGFAVGGIGVEGDGFYSIDVNVMDDNNRDRIRKRVSPSQR